MTAAATLQRSPLPSPETWPAESTLAMATAGVPPLSPRLQLVRAPLVALLMLSATLLIQFVLISSPRHTAAQQRAFDKFRSQLANGTAPIGPTSSNGRVLAIGTPVAYLEIPSIGVHEVVGEGTTAGALFNGPGHRRDTPLPGQVGTSVVYGRRAAFGGPFADLGKLVKGDLINVTTGQGTFKFRVVGVRYEGDPVPPPAAKGAGRLLLATAAGPSYIPSGVVRVDADLDGAAVIGPARLVTASTLPAEEKLMAGDTHNLWVLALWLQAMIVLAVAGVWAWHRWGRAQAWVVFFPPLVLVGLYVAGEAARLLPNLM